MSGFPNGDVIYLLLDEKLEELREEINELIEVSKELEINYMKKFQGQKVEVLIEEYKDGFSYGHTKNYLHCKVEGKFKQNEMIEKTIEKIEYPYCITK